MSFSWYALVVCLNLTWLYLYFHWSYSCSCSLMKLFLPSLMALLLLLVLLVAVISSFYYSSSCFWSSPCSLLCCVLLCVVLLFCHIAFKTGNHCTVCAPPAAWLAFTGMVHECHTCQQHGCWLACLDFFRFVMLEK